MRLFLRRQNRLTHEKEISSLFNGGSSVFCYPIKLVYSLTPAVDDIRFKVMFVVPKRSFKRAVKRNLMRRRIREAFRLRTPSVIDFVPSGQCLNLSFIYVSKDLKEFHEIEVVVDQLLSKLATKLK